MTKRLSDGSCRVFKPRLYREAAREIPTRLVQGEIMETGIVVPHRHAIIEGAYTSRDYYHGHICTLATYEKVDGKPRPIEQYDWKSRERVRADAIAEGRMREVDFRSETEELRRKARQFEDRRIEL